MEVKQVFISANVALIPERKEFISQNLISTFEFSAARTSSTSLFVALSAVELTLAPLAPILPLAAAPSPANSVPLSPFQAL
ncbi:hypothetical protein AN642_00155 [Epulopiscium sp. SCG-B10WGA-EpuloA2]|nr:hypothetical protein AN642_00155 [Epulopiscium sp. SCG-B10WGA-EpuloA2]